MSELNLQRQRARAAAIAAVEWVNVIHSAPRKKTNNQLTPTPCPKPN